MRLFRAFIFTTFFGVGAQAHSGFCVQNFNAYGPIYALKVRERTELFTGFLKNEAPCAVVHLQEVWNKSHISQVEINLKPEFNISAPNKVSRIGLMSLYKGDLVGRQTVHFNINNEGGVLDTVRDVLNVEKAFHAVSVKLPLLDEKIIFINTHLHPTSQAVRLAQVIDLLEWRLAHQSLKLVLTGDFNSDIHSLERQSLMLLLGLRDSMEEFLGRYPQSYCTYCVNNPLGWMLENHTFDYIFFSSVGTAETSLQVTYGDVNMRGLSGKPWSDHYGVRVHFDLVSRGGTAEVEIIEARRETTLKLLSRARKIFSNQRSSDFKPYLVKIKNLADQLYYRQGVFNSYFEGFN